MMRWIGFGYLIAAGGGAILPHPLRWWPLVITTVVAVIAVVGQVADQRAQVRRAADDADLAKTLDYLARARKSDVDDEWDQILNQVDADRSLGSITPIPADLRSVDVSRTRRPPRIPAQRTGGAA